MEIFYRRQQRPHARVDARLLVDHWRLCCQPIRPRRLVARTLPLRRGPQQPLIGVVLTGAVIRSRRHRTCSATGPGLLVTRPFELPPALTAGIHSYKGVHNILKNKLDQLERDQPPATPLPSHANIRGKGYYN